VNPRSKPLKHGGTEAAEEKSGYKLEIPNSSGYSFPLCFKVLNFQWFVFGWRSEMQIAKITSTSQELF
jgi:hypothetical protein